MESDFKRRGAGDPPKPVTPRPASAPAKLRLRILRDQSLKLLVRVGR